MADAAREFTSTIARFYGPHGADVLATIATAKRLSAGDRLRLAVARQGAGAEFDLAMADARAAAFAIDRRAATALTLRQWALPPAANNAVLARCYALIGQDRLPARTVATLCAPWAEVVR